MMRKFIVITLVISTALLGAILFEGYKKLDLSLIKDNRPATSTRLSFDDFINTKVEKMSLDEQRGQMFMISIPGTTLSDQTIEYLKDNHIGGVILLNHNIQSPEQVRNLTNDLKEKVNPYLLIAIDQEGGNVVRINWDKYAPLSARTLGSNYTQEQIYDIEFYRATLLKDLGINVLLGPVADIADRTSFMYNRSYSSDPTKTADIIQTIISAHQEAGILSVPKHFPGHGRTSVDSHVEFPVIPLTKQELRNHELKPFQAAIDTGVDFIMISHIINPLIDPQKPASQSQEYLKILEQDMGFDGIVITDDLRMTGQIKGGINWGINLTIEPEEQIGQRLNSITPEEQYISKLLALKYQKL